MISLNGVIAERTIKARLTRLQAFLKANTTGPLTNEESEHFKLIFDKYYTCDDKVERNDITKVIITTAQYNTKCFAIQVKLQPHTLNTSVKLLAGSNRTPKTNVTRAMRTAIMKQILQFRKTNPLNPNDMCPVGNCPLGLDAQVDHVTLFSELAKTWCAGEKTIPITYCNKDGFIMDEPLRSEWATFHLKNAKLRWLSKEGNKRAHLKDKNDSDLPDLTTLRM